MNSRPDAVSSTTAGGGTPATVVGTNVWSDDSNATYVEYDQPSTAGANVVGAVVTSWSSLPTDPQGSVEVWLKLQFNYNIASQILIDFFQGPDRVTQFTLYTTLDSSLWSTDGFFDPSALSTPTWVKASDAEMATAEEILAALPTGTFYVFSEMSGDGSTAYPDALRIYELELRWTAAPAPALGRLKILVDPEAPKEMSNYGIGTSGSTPIDEDFEEGTNGVRIDATNSMFTITEFSPYFDDTHSHSGDLAFSVNRQATLEEGRIQGICWHPWDRVYGPHERTDGEFWVYIESPVAPYLSDTLALASVYGTSEAAGTDITVGAHSSNTVSSLHVHQNSVLFGSATAINVSIQDGFGSETGVVNLVSTEEFEANWKDHWFRVAWAWDGGYVTWSLYSPDGVLYTSAQAPIPPELPNFQTFGYTAMWSYYGIHSWIDDVRVYLGGEPGRWKYFSPFTGENGGLGVGKVWTGTEWVIADP